MYVFFIHLEISCILTFPKKKKYMHSDCLLSMASPDMTINIYQSFDNIKFNNLVLLEHDIKMPMYVI